LERVMGVGQVVGASGGVHKRQNWPVFLSVRGLVPRGSKRMLVVFWNSTHKERHEGRGRWVEEGVV